MRVEARLTTFESLTEFPQKVWVGSI